MVSQVKMEMIRYFGNDAKRINHALKVYGFALAIAESEAIPSERKDVVELAAILHDIGINEAERKYKSSAGKYQEIEGPPIAREILGKLGTAEPVIDRVCFLIGHHHTYNAVDSLDFQILIEADFIVNCFEDAIGKDEIAIILDKYFKTGSGKEVMKALYLGEYASYDRNVT